MMKTFAFLGMTSLAALTAGLAHAATLDCATHVAPTQISAPHCAIAAAIKHSAITKKQIETSIGDGTPLFWSKTTDNIADTVTVSQSGPAFKHGPADVQIQVGGMPSTYQDAKQVPYIQSVTTGKNGKIESTNAILTDGVTVYYAAEPLRGGGINVQIWFEDNDLLSLDKATSDGMTINLPTMDQFQYAGAIVTSLGHPVSLTLQGNNSAHGNNSATLRFVVEQPHPL